MKAKIDNPEQEIKRLRDQITKFDDGWREKVHELECEVKELKNEIKELNESNDELETELENAEHKMKESQFRNTGSEGDIVRWSIAYVDARQHDRPQVVKEFEFDELRRAVEQHLKPTW
jgi:uncharacterized coiled-coil DUF342 family protein